MKAGDPVSTLRILNRNTGKVVEAVVQTPPHSSSSHDLHLQPSRASSASSSSQRAFAFSKAFFSWATFFNASSS
ncbi:MAG: hypothetical protein C0607_00905 [Azoarcus sp.]|nr:MAG: hypothetical protein C0607_00905 [Azoarcus sp.]